MKAKEKPNKKAVKRNQRISSTHADKHPYQRAELWSNGTLVFWDNDSHKREAYNDLFQRQCKEAARLNKA